jgi:riboflavin kinase/FMN adenylyltransferase
MLGRDAKEDILRGLGVDVVITQPFTPEFAALTAENFLPWLKARLPSLAAIHVGSNFRFGHGRQGDIAVLTEEARKQDIRILSSPPIQVDGAVVSSTRVRAQLQAGDIEAVNTLLGYHYFATGVVTPGKRLGRSIGFPTLNVPWSPELAPRYGVYAVRISGDRTREALPGVANYGLRPTVENSTEPRLEVHVLGACPFDAGDTVKVAWLRFLRPEIKFGRVDDLRAQIGRDRDAAAAFFARG